MTERLSTIFLGKYRGQWKECISSSQKTEITYSVIDGWDFKIYTSDWILNTLIQFSTHKIYWQTRYRKYAWLLNLENLHWCCLCTNEPKSKFVLFLWLHFYWIDWTGTWTKPSKPCSQQIIIIDTLMLFQNQTR
jgi:hypothetical protein